MKRPPTLTLVAIFLMGFLYLPVLLVVLFAFNSGAGLTWPIDGISLRWFDAIFNDSGFRGAFMMSIKAAVTSTAIATVVGGLGAIILERQRRWWLAPVAAVSRLPIMLPPLLIGVSLLTTIAALEISLSLATIVAGHVIFIIPYVLIVVGARLRGFDMQLEHAARDLGATPAQTLRRVTIPVILPAVGGAALLTFGLSFDEIYITNFVSGNDPTLTVYVLSKLRRTVDPSVNAVATVLLLIPWIALGLSALVMKRSFGAGSVLVSARSRE
ncbi:ABC transporter permease [Actinobacteria bacterium YIM 96077]|uniref:ABC transporter permease n=1 Tax=Phytoactinopolyspora halophila TaxID=1981511 RepID=A0A329QTN7_9ACTN|nr:ABC transporter permease [Phytoactinopolyspora halophila]AYY14944.1 ABC transporter permease [Actinobacteria bacterium YIM 96077]RAW15401.1 ABC transporter permease [Phytoactinopolyspora halophila]